MKSIKKTLAPPIFVDCMSRTNIKWNTKNKQRKIEENLIKIRIKSLMFKAKGS